MMLCTFFFVLAIPATSSIPLLLSLMVGMVWSQRKSFDVWCCRRGFDRDVQLYSDTYGVKSVPYAGLDITTTSQATVNAASTEPTVEYSVVDSGTDNNMFGVNSFVELGNTNMRIPVGGPMSDWKNEGLCDIDKATAFDHPMVPSSSYVLLVYQQKRENGFRNCCVPT